MKKFFLIAGAAVVAVFAVILLVFAPQPKPRTPVPPASASVAEVARVYLHAATTGDCGMTAALTRPSANGDAWSWCTNPRMVTAWDIRKPDEEGDAGKDERCVDFTMRNTTMSGMNAGVNPWGLCFEKFAAGWRVVDQGNG